MLFESLLIAFALYVIAALSILGNRLGLWGSWMGCAAGAFTHVILLNFVTALSPFAAGFIAAAITTLLRYVGKENKASYGLEHTSNE